VLSVAVGILIAIFQTPQTGTVIGVVKTSEGGKPTQARVILLTSNYTELWNRQVQQRLDNYWEIFKPEFAAHKERFSDIYRIVYLEASGYVANTMRRELGTAASKFMKETSSTGQFEFRGIPLGAYQILAQTTVNGQDVVWIQTVDVQQDLPVFVNLVKPTS
jgi:hypothetical protein